MSSVTFPISEVEPGQVRLKTAAARDAVERMVGGAVESCSHTVPLLEGEAYHALFAAAETAFSRHLTLVLTPDMLWITILQGLAQHVQANAEALRSRLVAHQGKVTIQVRRDDLVKGSFENPWEEVFPVFVEQMQRYLAPGANEKLSARFSSTGPVESAAAQVALMDCLQAYFAYDMTTWCGIPFVTLEGTVDDWRLLASKAHGLADFMPAFSQQLAPILPKFVEAAGGTLDAAFWRSMFKVNDASGGPYMTGWLTAFVPYLGQGRKNEHDWTRDDPFSGLTTSSLPASISQVPFQWHSLGTDYEMYLVSGIVGIEQDPNTLAVRPKVGWAVRDVSAAARTPEQRIQAAIRQWEVRGFLDDWSIEQEARRQDIPVADYHQALMSAGYRLSDNVAWTREE
ncbi:MAG TPA: DUF4419 domain-containing protein [Candidatus Xenobia bacterium]|jgi:hypothetical protein